MMILHPNMAETVARLRGETEARISAMIGDRTARAMLLTGMEQEYALDFVARLVTELREEKLWPKKPCKVDEDDGA